MSDQIRQAREANAEVYWAFRGTRNGRHICNWLALPPSLSGVHEVFHVFMLRKYTQDPTHVVDWGGIIFDTNGTFEEGQARILDSRDHVLQRKTVGLVKVLWQHQGVEEATWEREDMMQVTYHFLFENECVLSNIRSLIFELE